VAQNEFKKVLMDAHYMGFQKEDISKMLNELYEELLGESKDGGKPNE